MPIKKVKYIIEVNEESEEAFLEELEGFLKDFFENEVTIKKAD